MPTAFDLTTAHAATLRATQRARFAVRGMRTLVACVLIALLLTGALGTAFWPNLVHSVCIGTMCWLFIDMGRVQAARWLHRRALPGSPEAESRWPGWPAMLVLIAVGTLIGFTLGSALAQWITGQTTHGYLRDTLRQSATVMVGSLIPGVIITYYFYSRETIAAHQAAAQTAQRQAAENQLKLLESQLEPHMLFNTLANLRVLIGMDPPRAQAMLDQLIAFLRATLTASRASLHPLAAEFARLADYLALMQVRMGGRLRMHFELPPELSELPVPPLLLQPLVENSIKHGLEPNVAGGRITVSAAREGHTLVLRVRDTGAGLAADAASGTRFGLVQVRERLATLYGDLGSLTLEPATAPIGDDEGGTLATIRLPLPTPPSTAA